MTSTPLSTTEWTTRTMPPIAGPAAPVKVPLAELLPGESPRLGDADLEHARALMDVRNLPPVLVSRSTRRVVDGWHRVLAARLAGKTEIEVRYFDGDEQAAFVEAVQANLHQGLRLSRQERTAAAERITAAYPQWSNRTIAQAAGLSAKTVAAIRDRSTEDGTHLETRIGRDGRARPVNPRAGRERAAAYLKEHPAASLRSVAAAAGISVGTARDVRTRMANGEDPVQRTPGPAPGGTRAASLALRHRRARAGSLAKLARDPALRLSEAGRELLRLLDTRMVSSSRAEALRAAVPAYGQALLVAAVYEHIEAWLSFVDLIDQA